MKDRTKIIKKMSKKEFEKKENIVRKKIKKRITKSQIN